MTDDTAVLVAMMKEAVHKVAQRDALRALIARAVEAVEPFNALTPSDAERPGNTVVQISVYLGDLRRIATLAADLRNVGKSVADT